MFNAERRTRERICALLPATGTADGCLIEGVVRDLSASGVFLFTSATLHTGGTIDLRFILPSEVTNATPLVARCLGIVVRTETAARHRHPGVALRLESFELSEAPATEPFQQTAMTK